METSHSQVGRSFALLAEVAWDDHRYSFEGFEHGTPSMYAKHRCRCAECTAAVREEQRARQHNATLQGICKCGQPYETCKYPLSHGHPSIAHVKLPGRVARILNRLDAEGRKYPGGLTLQERDALQATRIHHNDFSTELEVPYYAAV